MKKCPHCSLEYPSGRSFGAHVTNCKMNPKRKKILEKISKTKRNRWKKFEVNCYTCNNKIEIFEKDTNEPKKERYFCSRSCANTYVSNLNRKEKNKKISKSLKKISKSLIKNKPKYFCKRCGSELKRKRKTGLCKKCMHKSPEYRERLSKANKGKNAGKKNGMYGKSTPHTKNIRVFSEKHTKNNFFIVRSTYEEKFVEIINKDDSIKKFTYEPNEYRVYFINEKGVERSYQPDFLINEDRITEIKNSYSIKLEETKIKEKTFLNQFPYMKYKILIETDLF